jgi:hypothetical protein
LAWMTAYPVVTFSNSASGVDLASALIGIELMPSATRRSLKSPARVPHNNVMR